LTVFVGPWDHPLMELGPTVVFDLVVVGSGAAGLTAALAALDRGCSVVLLEAEAWLGGATALSEGMIWSPNNPEALRLHDAPEPNAEMELAAAYLLAHSGNRIDVNRLRGFIEASPIALDFVGRKAGLGFVLNRASRDYYPDSPGATLGRRALNPLPFDARIMDRALFTRVRRPLGTMTLFGGLSIASQDVADYTNVMRHPRAAMRVLGHVTRYVRDRLQGWPRGTRLGNGNSIVARLANAIVRHGGEIRTDWPVTRIEFENGRVTGVSGPQGTIRSRLGVVLASGGLNASHAARREIVGPAPHVAIPDNSSWADLAGMIAGTGAQVLHSVSQPVLWAPASVVPAGLSRPGAWPHFSDRAKPGVLCLGPDGLRFANEAQVYHEFVPKMIVATARHPQGPHCWIVTDHTAIRRYGLGPIGPAPARLGPYLRAGYLKRGRTPSDLAMAIGLPPDAVTVSIAQFNMAARQGSDPLFGRGGNAYDRGNGDPSHRPNPTLGALDQGPFYAIRMIPGDIGTFIGLATDADARVLDDAGRPVVGLWAAGSAASPITGGTYPAAGLTIGPAMTFGYLAARNATAAAKSQRAAE
jgi:glycine/D-amino acid oxidase-like deaminating enzyme